MLAGRLMRQGDYGGQVTRQHRVGSCTLGWGVVGGITLREMKMGEIALESVLYLSRVACWPIVCK